VERHLPDASMVHRPLPLETRRSRNTARALRETRRNPAQAGAPEQDSAWEYFERVEGSSERGQPPPQRWPLQEAHDGTPPSGCVTGEPRLAQKREQRTPKGKT